MKYTFFALGFVLFVACKTPTKESDENKILNAKSIVEIVSISNGSIDDELIFSASTIYLKKNVVSASIPAFITNVRVNLGDLVKKGQILFELESKERRALNGSSIKLDSTLVNFGLIRIRASVSGVISTLDKPQPGDYVLEGTQLCTIAESNDLVFQVNVPFEFASFTQPGKNCLIQLSDNSTHEGIFTKVLTTMNAISQTQTILAKSKDNTILPENMVVKVTVYKNVKVQHQILPKSCVVSDEMMQEFWVMKLINDTTAVKIPVKIGNKNKDKIEILSPEFSKFDKIISHGNYGLSDTAFVQITTK